MISFHGDVYVGTHDGAIVVVDASNMVVHRVLHLQDSPIHCLFLINQFNSPDVTTRKLEITSVNCNYPEPEDEILLVNFALGYHGISIYSECHPPVYNYPQLTSLWHYQQPVVTPDKDDLYMLMWSGHS